MVFVVSLQLIQDPVGKVSARFMIIRLQLLSPLYLVRMKVYSFLKIRWRAPRWRFCSWHRCQMKMFDHAVRLTLTAVIFSDDNLGRWQVRPLLSFIENICSNFLIYFLIVGRDRTNWSFNLRKFFYFCNAFSLLITVLPSCNVQFS